MKQTLLQFLKKSGIFSSNKGIIAAIHGKKITVDGKIVKNTAYQLDPSQHDVTYGGQPVSQNNSSIYIVMNKPPGYVCHKLTHTDSRLGKKSIFSLLHVDQKTLNTLACAGRLDEDSTGLLIITNDGKLIYTVTHPKNRVKKTYDVSLAEPITSEKIQNIEAGVAIQLEENGMVTDYKTLPCSIQTSSSTRLRITLGEGKKREVKRMFLAVGSNVKSLSRVAIGNLALKELDLKEGAYKVVDKNYLTSKILISSLQ